jgi:hypothetical protein
MDAEQLVQNVRCLVAETHERKFKELRERWLRKSEQLG